MQYNRIGDVDVSEIAFDTDVARDLTTLQLRRLVETAFESGIDFFYSLQPAETSALGECLAALGARKKAVVTAGIPRLFAAYASHHLPAAEFLEHELSDRADRLGGGPIDCFVLDLGEGRSLDLDSVMKEDIAGADDSPVASSSYEGGIFLHETLAECLEVLARFKKDGRIRLAAVSGENISAVSRVLVKHEGIDVAFAPYNYGFRAAANELISVAAEVKTAFIATRPLWWGIREIPVTVLAESPYPAQASVDIDPAELTSVACAWPLADRSVKGILAELNTAELVARAASASHDHHWTRDDEDALRPVASVAAAQKGLFLILSAMNSPDPSVRAHGWAACMRRGLPDFNFDPVAPADVRLRSLRQIADTVVQAPPVDHDDLDELL